MAKPLSPKEEKSFSDLEKDFSKKAAEYKTKKWDELVAGNREALTKELTDIRGYLELYNKGEVADLEVNIQWMRKKVEVLTDILDVRHIKDAKK